MNSQAEISLLRVFLEKVEEQGKRKAELYDGINTSSTLDRTLRLLTEEIGEVASAVTRDRFQLAKVECIDVAHCAFLVYLALEGIENG